MRARDISRLPAPDIARAGIGYVPQGRGLFAGMTVRENLSLGRLARKTDGSNGVVWDEAQILEYFPRLRERMDVAADYLSGGEQQMVAVARAMSGNVKLLLLDEPFEGLAPTVILELFKVFDQLAAAHLDRDRRAQSRSGAGAGRPRLRAGARRGVPSGAGAAAADRSRLPQEDFVAVISPVIARASDEAIHLSAMSHDGLLRCARNDGTLWEATMRHLIATMLAGSMLLFAGPPRRPTTR